MAIIHGQQKTALSHIQCVAFGRNFLRRNYNRWQCRMPSINEQFIFIRNFYFFHHYWELQQAQWPTRARTHTILWQPQTTTTTNNHKNCTRKNTLCLRWKRSPSPSPPPMIGQFDGCFFANAHMNRIKYRRWTVAKSTQQHSRRNAINTLGMYDNKIQLCS